MVKKRIFITGGHLTPALAVIEELRKLNDWQVYFVGRKYPLEGDQAIAAEYQIINDLKIPFLILNTGRFQRKFTPYTLASLIKIPWGLIQSFFYLVKYQPSVILSFGGYLAFPVCLVGYLLRIPIITHEQTVQAGLANRIIALLAKKICLSYQESQKYFPLKKTVITGLPLRTEIFEVKRPSFIREIDRPILYITGGSLGCHQINYLISEILKELLADFFIIQQTGQSLVYQDYEKLSEKKNFLPNDLKKRYFLKTYFSSKEIGWVLNSANLIISRAGANTVAELITLSKPTIFIPLPFASEQKDNALMANKFIPVKILNQEQLTPEKLLWEIKDFWNGVKKRKVTIQKKTPIIKNPAQLIIKEIYGVIKRA